MSSSDDFDPVRSRAIRQLLVDTADRSSGPRRRPSRLVTIIAGVAAAIALMTGGAAFALNAPAFLRPHMVFTGTTGPAERDLSTPQVTPPPATAEQAAANASFACQIASVQLRSGGDGDQLMGALLYAQQAAALDPKWQPLASDLAALITDPTGTSTSSPSADNSTSQQEDLSVRCTPFPR
jgi:hypothetical protein